nr:cytochrome oxidase assembly protein [Ipomoea batatas]
MHNSKSGVAILTFAKPFIAGAIVYIRCNYSHYKFRGDGGRQRFWRRAAVSCYSSDSGGDPRPLAAAVSESCSWPAAVAGSQEHNSDSCKMVVFRAFDRLAPKTKNLVVAGGLSGFVFGVYFYTMRAVGGTDELQIAIDKFEQEKQNKDTKASLASNT